MLFSGLFILPKYVSSALTISNANHSGRLKGLDKDTGALDPIVNHTGIASTATRLIGKLPSKDS